MSSTLRKRLIRLAHEKPELRPSLLPLLRAGSDRAFNKAVLQSASYFYPGTDLPTYAASDAAESLVKMWSSQFQEYDPEEFRKIMASDLGEVIELLTKWQRNLRRAEW